MRCLLACAALLLAGCSAPPVAPPTTTVPVATEESPLVHEWREGAPDPAPRYEIALARVGTDVYEIGGLTQGLVPTNVVAVYDAKADAWRPGPTLPIPMHHHAAVTAACPGGGECVYAFGMWATIQAHSSDVYLRLDPKVGAWELLGQMPHARGAHAAAVLDGKVYLVGGTDAAAQMLKDVDVYDPVNGSWSKAAPLPDGRDHHALVAHDGKLYLFAGRQKTLGTTTNETFVYDPAADAWSQLAPVPTARGGIAAVEWNGRLVVLGGEVAGNPRLLRTVEAFDPANNTWAPMPDLLRPRTGLGATVIEDRILVVSGACPDGTPLCDAPEWFGES